MGGDLPYGRHSGVDPADPEIVIPGLGEAESPESMNTGSGIWIPGSPLRGAPE
jgi:hypothetical protein